MAVQTRRRLFSVADYEHMIAAGVFAEDERVELIDGEVRAMTPIGPRHAATVNRLNALLARQLSGAAIVSVQNPVRLSDYTEPQPDLAVLRPRDDFYARAHPTAADVLLVIEVADTSIEDDRDEKIPRYAQAAIPETWLVDLGADTVECYRQPAQGQYRTKQTFERGQTVIARAVTGLSLDVEAIFGGLSG